MSGDMSASVILRMVDNLTAPARNAGKSVKDLIKDLEKLQKLSGMSKANTSLSAMTKNFRSAQRAATSLNKAMANPKYANYTRAAQSIGKVGMAARRAADRVRDLNYDLRWGGGGRFGGGGRGGSGGRGGAGGQNARQGGGFGSYASSALGHMGSSLLHVGVFEAVDRGIHAIGSGIHTGFEQGFEKAHTIAMLRAQGESQDAVNEAVAKAQELTKTLPQFTTAQHLEAIAELRPALQHGLKEALDLAPLMQKSVAVLEAVKQGAGAKAMAGLDAHGEALSLVRALEVKGVTAIPGKLGQQAMESYVDGITKAIIAFNGQIKAEDFHSAFKYSRGASNNWSESFATTVLPTLMNELKKSSKADASQTGNALSSMFAAVVQGDIAKDRAVLWDKMGMLRPGTFTRGKEGIKIKKGEGVVGADLFASDPYRFMQDILLPHMAAHGIDINNREQVVRTMGGLFGNRVARQIAVILATQQAIIEKDRENVKRAMGLNGLDFLKNADPTMRSHILAASLKELAGALGDVGMPGTVRGMKGIIDWAHALTETIHKSKYMETLKGSYEAMVAGMFGQKLGRRGMGMDAGMRGYYQAGAVLSHGFTHLAESIGKSLAGLERAGVFKASLEGLGLAMDGVAGACDLARESAKAMADAFNVSFSKGGVIDSLLKMVGLDKDTRDALAHGPLGRNKGRAYQPEADTGPTPVSGPAGGRNGSKAPDLGIEKLWNGLTYKLWKMVTPDAVNPVGKYDFGQRAVPSVPNVIAPIAAQADAAKPIFAAAGGGVGTSVAAGIQSNEGVAMTAMQTLMANLAAITSQGITIPVKLDTAGAEAQARSLTSSYGRLGSRAQFSPRLSDAP